MASLSVHRKNNEGIPTVWRVTTKVEGKWRPKYFNSEKEAKLHLLDCQRQELESGAVAPANGNNALFKNVWDRFVAIYVSGQRQATQYNYHRAFGLVSEDIRTIHDFTAENITTAFLRKKNKPRTRLTHLAKLKKFHKWANRNGHSITIDWEKVHENLVRKVVDNKQFLTPVEYRKILAWFSAKKLESRLILIQTLAERGFRINELLKSTIEDINWSNHTITIRPEIEKTNKSRTVYLGDFLLGIISQRREEYNKSKNNAIFIDERTGGPLRYRTMKKWWSIACKDLKITGKPIHRLRALAFFFIYKASNHNIELCKQICGWQSSAYKFYVSSYTDEMPHLSKTISRLATGWVYPDEDKSSIGDALVAAMASSSKTLDQIAADVKVDRMMLGHLMELGLNPELAKIEAIAKYLGYRITLTKEDPSVQNLNQKVPKDPIINQ